MNKQYIYAGVILEDNDRILMLKHTKQGVPDAYFAPHGLVKTGERLRDVAKREIFQQCGLVVEARQLLYVEEIITPVEGFRFWFRGEWIAGDPMTECLPHDDDGLKIETRWLTQAEVASRSVDPLMLLVDYWSMRETDFESPRYIII